MAINKNINKKEVGLRISDLRKNKNLSMDELAKIVGVGGRSTINGWEKGRSLPTNEYLKKICETFKVSETFLLYGTLKESVTNLLNFAIYTDFNKVKEKKQKASKIDLKFMEDAEVVNIIFNGLDTRFYGLGTREESEKEKFNYYVDESTKLANVLGISPDNKYKIMDIICNLAEETEAGKTKDDNGLLKVALDGLLMTYEDVFQLIYYEDEHTKQIKRIADKVDTHLEIKVRSIIDNAIDELKDLKK